MFDGKAFHYQQAIIQNDGFLGVPPGGYLMPADFEKSPACSIPAVHVTRNGADGAALRGNQRLTLELAARRESLAGNRATFRGR